MVNRLFFFVSLAFLIVVTPSVTVAQGVSVAERARQTEAQMTDDERFGMIDSILGAATLVGMKPDPRIPKGTAMSAGYAHGVPRLGVPAQLQTDASMGIANPGYRPDDAGATALPSAILVGSNFSPPLARRIGDAIGREARVRGFNVVLAGGANLTSEVRNGRMNPPGFSGGLIS